MKTDLEIWHDLTRRLRDPNAPPRVVAGLNRGPGRGGFEAPGPSAEDRAEYDYLLAERAGLLMDSGAGQAEADALAAGELGCFDFWHYARSVNAWVGAREVRATAARFELPRVYCPRCESRGHAVEACPFPPNDADVLKVARLRRERRAGREAAA